MNNGRHVNGSSMYKGIVSMKVLAAVSVGSLLVAACGDTVAGNENAQVQVGQTLRSSALPKLATGYNFGLALKDGAVWAWGRNGNHQLGDGTTTNRATPMQVQGLTGTFVGVAAGADHAMALRSDGTLWAWGRNDGGQMGIGTVGVDSIPVQVQTLTNVVAMAGGYNFSVGVESNGDVWAWGHNGSCQLGIGPSYNPSAVPVRVTTTDPAMPYLTGVVAIAAGPLSALAVGSDGSLWAWGQNANGRLGDGTNTERCRAVRISYPDPTPNDSTDNVVPVDVAMGEDHSLALFSNGAVMAWGNNGSGQLGLGSSSSTPYMTPVLVPNFAGVTQIDAGKYTSLAVSNGKFFAWGSHTYGQICSGSGGGWSNSMYTVPTPPSVLVNMSYVGAGYEFSVGMASDGKLWSCGFEGYDALGYDVPGAATTNILTQVPNF
ncbi:RCC1 domain-containing protein [Archangium lansingense]|uniref:RCC1-like domain-containing protein n=1 Tax=Archangium lansingense TaxID=2995310 RepID=A0ABT4ANC6_9BACT|nr:RCC1 domain-containing protein [Archangium lansinium]MCY1083195.1 hypothetical protein [Archangium lansinium]